MTTVYFYILFFLPFCPSLLFVSSPLPYSPPHDECNFNPNSYPMQPITVNATPIINASA
ncbi:hypothetical protein EX30DRAFT_340928 [Ascodesmis nigricans]|uniref:Uncharacterized protein n=1 Tax=Ascodesmis nigricans TaxID=341454 RepID=A0A4V3SIT7_9PEZI|nr:hypothetical protein EX30DRAFT_340928 [Ascodesmis nigricans]